MSFTIAQFRSDFPEFADTAKYSDSSITFWSGIGLKQLNANRWGNLYDAGMELFVAHNIALQAMDQEAADAGSIPGTQSGLVGNQSAGGVSVSIDNQATIETGGGNYNLTVYGTRFIRLARLSGIGGLQIW